MDIVSTHYKPLRSPKHAVKTQSRSTPKLPPFFTRVPDLRLVNKPRIPTTIQVISMDVSHSPPVNASSPPRVRMYILFYSDKLLKQYGYLYKKYPWAHPIIIKKQDKTFENAFWKQLLELKSEWTSLEMVGTLSWTSYKKINLNTVNDIISNRSAWKNSKYYHFMETNGPVTNGGHSHLLQILQDVCKTLEVKLGTAAHCNYFMCSPSKMEAFINWFEQKAKPTVLAHPLSMTNAIYGPGILNRRELQTLCGVPYYPHAPFVIERLNKFFFDKLATQSKSVSHYPTLFSKYNLNISDASGDILYETVTKAPIIKAMICHFHVHDITTFAHYAQYLANIKPTYNIILTFTMGGAAALTTSFMDPDITYLKVPNKGLDIGPKLCALHYLNANNITYDFLLCLHSQPSALLRHKLFDPLVKDSTRIQLITNILTLNKNVAGVFPNLTFDTSSKYDDNCDPFVANKQYHDELLSFIGIHDRKDDFVAGNCFILHKSVIDAIFKGRLEHFYNSLNDTSSFDFNWFKLYHKLPATTSLEDAYYLFKEQGLPGNNIPLADTCDALPDGMFEHTFEQIWLNVIRGLGRDFLVLDSASIASQEQIKFNTFNCNITESNDLLESHLVSNQYELLERSALAAEERSVPEVVQPPLPGYLSLKEKFMLEYPTADCKNPKEEFRYFCYRYMPYMRTFAVPDIQVELKNEAVLIEYRKFPHVEFIIRNAIHKLGNSWSYTVVCGTLNYEFMKTLGASIHPNIRVIQTSFDNLFPSSYSAFLASSDFWNMFVGEKILIYQEDSIIFRKGIKVFLDWDYIGAPWPKGQNDAPILVGNGGFSLRTRKCMLDVISRISIANTKVNSCTEQYMRASGNTVVPEDVYFTKNMQELGIGKVAPIDVGFLFSTESRYSPTSLGGHNFWLSDPSWKDRLYRDIVIQFNCETKCKTTHRGGWASVLNVLHDAELLTHTPAPNEFLSMVEEVYLWKSMARPKKPWSGVVHCTPTAPDYYNSCNISFLITSKEFIEDIKTCRVLFTLCDYVTNYLRKNIRNSPKIITLIHPVVTANIPLFSMDSYLANTNKHLLQIGQQLRKVTSILRIKPAGFKRLWLTGNPDLKHCESMVQREFKNIPNKTKYPCDLCYTKTFEEYDDFLTKNIAFIDLFDSAANNTVLECIVRNTPILVNRTPGVLEYLGVDYPLYFNTLDEVEGLLCLEKIQSAHDYLRGMDKSRFKFEHFVKEFADSL